MGDVTLSTGKVVTLDLSKITMGEWRSYFSGRGSALSDDKFIEKITGIQNKEQDAMLRDDYRRIVQAIVQEGNRPLDNPNSQSESTSD
jgi:hypothetical protein